MTLIYAHYKLTLVKQWKSASSGQHALNLPVTQFSHCCLSATVDACYIFLVLQGAITYILIEHLILFVFICCGLVLGQLTDWLIFHKTFNKCVCYGNRFHHRGERKYSKRNRVFTFHNYEFTSHNSDISSRNLDVHVTFSELQEMYRQRIGHSL